MLTQDGVETDSAVQISCTPHGDFAIMEWHYCFQYVNHGRPRTCTAPQIIYVVKPLQEQYVNETVASGFLTRPGNGAYFHSCHSGGYWVSADVRTPHDCIPYLVDCMVHVAQQGR